MIMRRRRWNLARMVRAVGPQSDILGLNVATKHRPPVRLAAKVRRAACLLSATAPRTRELDGRELIKPSMRVPERVACILRRARPDARRDGRGKRELR